MNGVQFCFKVTRLRLPRVHTCRRYKGRTVIPGPRLTGPAFLPSLLSGLSRTKSIMCRHLTAHTFKPCNTPQTVTLAFHVPLNTEKLNIQNDKARPCVAVEHGPQPAHDTKSPCTISSTVCLSAVSQT